MSVVYTRANTAVATNSPFNQEQLVRQPAYQPGNHDGSRVRFAYKVMKRYLQATDPIEASARGDVVMREINHALKNSMATTKGWDIIHYLLYKRVVFFGSISSVSIISSHTPTTVPPTYMTSRQFMVADIETVRPGQELVFSSFDRSVELTSALDRPTILQSVSCFAESYPDVTTGSMTTKFVVVALELQKRALVRLVVCALLISVIAGVVVGIMMHNVQAGFGCFAGLVAVVSIALAVVLEMHK